MTENESRRGSSRARKSGAAVGIAVGLAAALYVTLGPQGNDPAAARCTGTADIAASLDPLVGGEVAAFQIAAKPHYLGDLAFKDAEGAPKTLADFSDRVTLVNLWATWCAPCRQEMPALDRLQAAEGGDDFGVVPISIDTAGRDKAAAFLGSIGVEHLPLYTDSTTEIFNALKERSLALGLPVTLILDRKGCTIGHMNGPAEWDGEDGRRLIRAAVAGVAKEG